MVPAKWRHIGNITVFSDAGGYYPEFRTIKERKEKEIKKWGNKRKRKEKGEKRIRRKSVENVWVIGNKLTARI